MTAEVVPARRRRHAARQRPRRGRPAASPRAAVRRRQRRPVLADLRAIAHGVGYADDLGALQRRLAAVLDPKVGSVASLFVSRWDVAIHDRVPAKRRNRLGIALAQRTLEACRELLAPVRCQQRKRAQLDETASR
jgi:transaldolase